MCQAPLLGLEITVLSPCLYASSALCACPSLLPNFLLGHQLYWIRAYLSNLREDPLSK